MSKRLEQLQAFLEKSPEEPFILFAIAKEYEKIQADAKALEYYALLVEKKPDYVGTYYHYGKLLEKTEKDVQAFKMYIKGMEIARKAGDQHSLSELAAAKMELGDEEDFL